MIPGKQVRTAVMHSYLHGMGTVGPAHNRYVCFSSILKTLECLCLPTLLFLLYPAQGVHELSL